MKHIFSTLLFLFFALNLTAASADTYDCDKPTIISSVDEKFLLLSYLRIKACASDKRKLDIYVHGEGGGIVSALTFFELMRSSGLSKHVRFIAISRIASASNLVWLAADERVVTRGATFVIHEIDINNDKEDVELRMKAKGLHVENTTAAVRLAAGNEAAELWRSRANDEQPGMIFGGKEAVRLGWATKLLTYK